MDNLLGALIIEIEENRFKPNLIEDSDITYGKTLGTIDDKFNYTDESMTVGRQNNLCRLSMKREERVDPHT